MNEKMIAAMADVRLGLKMGLSDADLLAVLKHLGFKPAMALTILNAAKEP